MSKFNKNLKTKTISKISTHQLRSLREIFAKYQDLTDKQMEALALVINLNYCSIKEWFEIKKLEKNYHQFVNSKKPILKECKIMIEKLDPNLFNKLMLTHSIRVKELPITQKISTSTEKINNSSCSFELQNKFGYVSIELINSEVSKNENTIIKYDRTLDDDTDDDFFDN